MNLPVQTIENNKLIVRVSLTIYNKEAIVAALYGLIGLCFIHQEYIDENTIDVFFESKEDGNTNLITNQFCNNLIDEQVRYNTNRQFGKIRDMIVEEAFRPITK